MRPSGDCILNCCFIGITQISGNISNNNYPLSWVIKQLFHTFLCNSQNYHPLGAVDDPMHCCPRPSALGNSASGHPQHLEGDSFDCCTERYEIVVYYITGNRQLKENHHSN